MFNKLFYMKKFILFFLLLCSISAEARNLYLVELKIWKDETFNLFNFKNQRNAVDLELPIDKDLFNSLKEGDILQNNSVYKSAFDILPYFFKTYKIKVIKKRVQKIDNLPEKKSNQLFMLKLKSQKYETFSFNLKNSRNAIIFELPVDEDFYKTVKKGEKLKSQNVYTEAFDILPEFFSEIAITVEEKRVAPKK